MAFLEIDIYSSSLMRNTEVAACIPERYIGDKRSFHNDSNWDKDWGKWPVVWLLHGATCNYLDWWRFTSVERYCEEYGFAAVSFSADMSFYANINTGRYFDWLTEELPEKLDAMLPVISDREGNFLAGFSMGGHGTLKAGLIASEKYAAICPMSAGNLLLADWEHASPRQNKDHLLYLGSEKAEDLFRGEHDVYYLAEEAVRRGNKLPKILYTCGYHDLTYEDSKACYEYLKKLGYDVEFDESEGMHNFDYWDKKIELFFQWIKQNGLYPANS
ncbi:MAG: hypothetical protein IJJ67_05170 [Oscillospiraceae bacterium]|nr:hypothetical protein [Oscillospiraceae bacterium]